MVYVHLKIDRLGWFKGSLAPIALGHQPRDHCWCCHSSICLYWLPLWLLCPLVLQIGLLFFSMDSFYAVSDHLLSARSHSHCCYHSIVFEIESIRVYRHRGAVSLAWNWHQSWYQPSYYCTLRSACQAAVWELWRVCHRWARSSASCR